MDIYVARQPIFDIEQKVYGYELLFRSGLNNYFDSSSQDLATTRVIDNSFLVMGIETITSGRRALINFTSELLKQELPTLFPKDLIGVEILESVRGDDEIIACCKKLKKMGYLLFLDDFVFSADLISLVELADVIKVDFLTTSRQQKQELVKRFGKRYGISFLAERIETFDQLEEAIELGYSYFQGYFFCKPDIVSGREIPGYKLTNLRVLQELNREDISFDAIADIVKTDVSMSYKVLKLVNSAAFGLSRKVDSIKEALVILGLIGTKKLINLICLNNMGQEKPDELLITSLLRARFGEVLAKEMGMKEKDSQFFLLGLFSSINAFLDRSMDEIMKDLPIQQDVKAALLGEDNFYNQALNYITAYEGGDWGRVQEFSKKLNLNEERVPDLYRRSIIWTQKLLADFSS